MINGRESLEVKAEGKALQHGVSKKLNAARHTYRVHENKGHRRVTLKAGQTAGFDLQEMWHEGKEVLPWMKAYYTSKGRGYTMGPGWKKTRGVVYNIWTDADALGIDDKHTPVTRLGSISQLDAFLSKANKKAAWPIPSAPQCDVVHSTPSEERYPFIKPLGTRNAAAVSAEQPVQKNTLPDVCLAAARPFVDITNKVNPEKQKEAMLMEAKRLAQEEAARILEERRRARMQQGRKAEPAKVDYNSYYEKYLKQQASKSDSDADDEGEGSAASESSDSDIEDVEATREAEFLEAQRKREEQEKREAEEQKARIEALAESVVTKLEEIEAKQQELDDLRDAEYSTLSSSCSTDTSDDEEIKMKSRELERRRKLLAKKRESLSDLEAEVSTSEDESNDLKANLGTKKTELEELEKANKKREQAMEKRGNQLAMVKNHKENLFAVQLGVQGAYEEGFKTLDEDAFDTLQADVEAEMRKAETHIRKKGLRLKAKERELEGMQQLIDDRKENMTDVLLSLSQELDESRAFSEAEHLVWMKGIERKQTQNGATNKKVAVLQSELDALVAKEEVMQNEVARHEQELSDIRAKIDDSKHGARGKPTCGAGVSAQIKSLKGQVHEEQEKQKSLLTTKEAKLEELQAVIEAQRAEIDDQIDELERQNEKVQLVQKQHDAALTKKAKSGKEAVHKVHVGLQSEVELLDDQLAELKESTSDKQKQMQTELEALEHEMQALAEEQDDIKTKEEQLALSQQKALEKIKSAEASLLEAKKNEEKEKAELEQLNLKEEKKLATFAKELESKRKSAKLEVEARKKRLEEEETALKARQLEVAEAVSAQKQKEQELSKKVTSFMSELFTDDASSEEEAPMRPSTRAIVKAGKEDVIEMPNTPSTNTNVRSSEGSIENLLASARKSLRKSAGRRSTRRSGRASVAETAVTGLSSPPKRRPVEKKARPKRRPVVEDDATTIAPSSVAVGKQLAEVTAAQAQHLVNDDDDTASRATGLTMMVGNQLGASPVKKKKSDKKTKPKAKSRRPIEDDQTVISTIVPTKELDEVKAAQADLLVDDTASAITTATAMTYGVSKMLDPKPTKREAKSKAKKAAKRVPQDDDAMTTVSTMVPTKELAEVKAKQAAHLEDDTASAITTATAMTLAALGPAPTKTEKSKGKKKKKTCAPLEGTRQLEEVEARQAAHLEDSQDTADTKSVDSRGTSISKLMPPPKPKPKSRAGKRKADKIEAKELEEVEAKQAEHLEDDAKSVESSGTGLSAVNKMVGPAPKKAEKSTKSKAGKRKAAKVDVKELEEVEAKQVDHLQADDDASVASGATAHSSVSKLLGPEPVKAEKKGKGKKPPTVPGRKRKSTGKEHESLASPPKKSRKSVRFSNDVSLVKINVKEPVPTDKGSKKKRKSTEKQPSARTSNSGKSAGRSSCGSSWLDGSDNGSIVSWLKGSDSE